MGGDKGWKWHGTDRNSKIERWLVCSPRKAQQWMWLLVKLALVQECSNVGEMTLLSMPALGRAWTAAARLEAVIVTAVLDETGKSAWCREYGVYPCTIDVGL